VKTFYALDRGASVIGLVDLWTVAKQQAHDADACDIQAEDLATCEAEDVTQLSNCLNTTIISQSSTRDQ
jgi:hypothetical protein